MRIYFDPCVWTVYGTVEVRAESKEDALKKAEAGNWIYKHEDGDLGSSTIINADQFLEEEDEEDEN